MNVEIAERLARRRREAGYSQENLAERLGVTRQAVSKWERSESSPDTDNLIGLAKLYGVSLDELLNVDPSIADDVAFEAADKAAAGNDYTNASSRSDASVQPQASSSPQDKQTESSSSAESFTFIDDGVNLTDDDGSTVNINWHDGVHIKDGKTGEEVRVGWSGIHIGDKGRRTGRDVSDRGEGHGFSSHGARAHGGVAAAAATATTDWADGWDENISDAHMCARSFGSSTRSKHKA